MNNTDCLNKLCTLRDDLRKKWRDVRDEKLLCRDQLLVSGKTSSEVRHDRRYRILWKKQRQYSVKLRQVERRISRQLALMALVS